METKSGLPPPLLPEGGETANSVAPHSKPLNEPSTSFDLARLWATTPLHHPPSDEGKRDGHQH